MGPRDRAGQGGGVVVSPRRRVDVGVARTAAVNGGEGAVVVGDGDGEDLQRRMKEMVMVVLKWKINDDGLIGIKLTEVNDGCSRNSDSGFEGVAPVTGFWSKGGGWTWCKLKCEEQLRGEERG
jgi:hypothetical protein